MPRDLVHDPAPPVLTRVARLAVTLLVLAAAGGAVVAGSRLIAGRQAAVAEAPAAPPLPVAVMRPVQAAGYTVTRRFVGRISPGQQARLGFEQAGRLADVAVEEGDTVAAGSVLATLDTRSLEAERRAAAADRDRLRAEAELARLTADRRGALRERGFAATQSLDEARLALEALSAAIRAADARIEALDVLLSKAKLVAPFDGRIGARLLDPGATVAPGTPVVEIFSAGPAELRVGIPETLAASLVPGASIAVEIGAHTVDAVLVALRPDLDAATRTREIMLRLPATDRTPAFGDTATALVETQIDAEGFTLPVTALREGQRGTWTVMLAEAAPGGTVARPEVVEILATDGTAAFVRGAIQPGALVVSTGMHRITPGQSIRPVEP